MSTPKASSRHRSSGADTPTKGNRSFAGQSTSTSPHPMNNSSSTTSAPFSKDGGVRLTHFPVHTLPYLQELLRPTAASRVAAVSRLLHMDGDVSTVSGVGADSRSASAAARSAVDGSGGGGSAASAPPPPPAYATSVAAAGGTSAGPVTVRARAAGSETPISGTSSSLYRSPNYGDATPSTSASTAAAATAQVTSQPTVPSLPMLLECAAQLSSLLAQWRTCAAAERRDATGRPPQAPLPPASATAAAAAAGSAPNTVPSRPSPETILQLMNAILWYCLATAEDARLAHGGRSHGTSGRATPALPSTAAAMAAATAAVGGSSTPLYARGHGGSVGRATSTARSGASSVSVDPNDWLGSRMSTAAASTAGVATVTMTDDQLAEHLFRPAIDAVVLLQDRPSLSAGNVEASAKGKGKSSKGGKPAVAPAAAAAAAMSEVVSEDLGEELQTVALWMLAAVLVRFADAPFNASVFLPVLFPQVDVRGEKGSTVRHPILQPLLRGDRPSSTSQTPPPLQQAATQKKSSNSSSPAVGGLAQQSSSSSMSLRCGAASALTALVHKLQPTLQYAEEPHPNRQAFVSLATQCGTMLLSLHESLCWALETVEGVAPTATATPLLNTYAAVVGVTPYNRCPRSRTVVLHTLQLPIIRTYLTRDEGSEYVPTTVLVASVFKNESMRGAAAQLLAGKDASAAFTVTSGDLQTAKKTSTKATTTDNTNSSRKGVDNRANFGNAGANNAVSVISTAPSESASSFLAALLRHADTRVEVWRCLVPLSRLYPRMVHNEFNALMQASVRVVATLTNWEAAEVAAEQTALETSTAEKGTDELKGATTPRGQREGQQKVPDGHSAGPSLTTSPARASAAENTDHSSTTTTTVTAPSLLSRIRPGPSTPPEAFAECLRTWLHFMGYVWKAFDDNACDPAQSPEGQLDRATAAQKQRIHLELLRPAMQLRRCGEEVRTMTLRCIAQIGDDYLRTIHEPALGEELVRYVQTCIADPQPRVRGEALTTLGMWLWQYPSMDVFACVAIDNAVHSLLVDPNALVRTKAAFALSNITGRLPEGTCPTVRDSPEYIATLCSTAMHAAVIDGESGVQGHGIRMMNHLLQVLSFDELISEVPEFEEGVAEGFLRVLLECLRAATRSSQPHAGGSAPSQPPNASADGSGGVGWYAAPREAKHRWNAAYALGMGLAREEVFEAEPKYAVEAVEALCAAVVRDHIFKVRTQAATALGRIPGDCLCATYSAEDLTPKVVKSLCEALESATATENFRQYKEQGSLHDALHAALAVMITTARPSIELDKVFSGFQKLLQREKLL